ncbi:IclR family transcriptional regulator [Pseudonocardia thermophila]|uniref:IclR family transcriptional regulator n=1 Tax=Pseudonocardia thermophila TaxID=1848 RepID=UPI00248DFB22|nr:IclR family transcriptional regulator [Pseudonocardia thermophila]
MDGKPESGPQDNMAARVVAVLDALARCPKDGVSVRQLAADLSMSRSAVHRILQTMTELNVARALKFGGYEAGPVLIAWASFLADRHNLLSAARHIMSRIMNETGETVYLFTYKFPDTFATMVASEQCDKPLRFLLEPGATSQLNRGAAGKVILAHLPSSVFDALDLDAEGPTQAVAAREQLRADLALVRERGFAITFGERVPEAIGVAAAYFVDGRPAGSMTVTFPQFRADAYNLEEIGRIVSEGANELTRLLNAVDPNSDRSHARKDDPPSASSS